MWNGTTSIDLGTLGGRSSIAYAINATGEVVGSSAIAGGEGEHAALWTGTTVIDLNSFLDASTVSAGWVLTWARGINDKGWIVGNVHNSISDVNHAFLLTPVPEPETYAMLLAGLGLLGFMARRRKTA